MQPARERGTHPAVTPWNGKAAAGTLCSSSSKHAVTGSRGESDRAGGAHGVTAEVLQLPAEHGTAGARSTGLCTSCLCREAAALQQGLACPSMPAAGCWCQ